MPAKTPRAETPSVSVLLPDVLVRLFPGARREVNVSASSVAEAIEELDALWPGIADRLCESTPAIRRHVNIFVEGQRATLDTPLSHGAEVIILPAISGG